MGPIHRSCRTNFWKRRLNNAFVVVCHTLSLYPSPLFLYNFFVSSLSLGCRFKEQLSMPLDTVPVTSRVHCKSMAAIIPSRFGNVSDMNICPVMWCLSSKTLLTLTGRWANYRNKI
ncbi:hypothetical protein BDV37DRAFT_245727 [Aspergillus pseudonomiae]|uniref:Uncharacterized protein n=1 Tax=Aspergillus pseudonomiae TaxID=1506151 RepID=A0A5N7DF98_9EURO|nr:uncharacterized protein BDV37DRAFT_245727 [Aspergillus pseudonomiae]KAE8405102.1 hypothetical protein BDV37DRAFT_245727 [Aspergillus pseudonomiae]